MLLGYVSDESYVALADVAIEIIAADGSSIDVRSRASGSIHAELSPGSYTAILQKAGYGSKRSPFNWPSTVPVQFRLLSDCLLGYAWPKWARAGEESEFRVHSVEPYHLELWHYGWEPRLVRALGWHDEHGPRAVMQTTPDADYTQTGCDWNGAGFGGPVHRPYVVAPDRSGLYYFRASTPSGRRFSFPWIVAPARPRARLAVLASNLTWNAYNAFGGRSNYIQADGLQATPTVNARQQLTRFTDPARGTWGFAHYPPLSFDRPEPFNDINFDERITDPIEGRQACHLAPAEWRLLGWLDREQIDFDYYAESQLHDGTLDLSAYRAMVIAVHPEYWTRAMFDRVHQWVFEQGGRLIYLGGNGLNCEVELHANQSMTCHNGQISSLWPEGMGGHDSRMAMRHRSEAHLLGVVFTPAGAMTGAPYRVVDADHWAFAGTGLMNGQLFGERSLHRRCPGGASGHETDKRSTQSPSDTRLLARGTNPDDGGAEMTIVEAPSGGRVFSVGSINYVASLPIDDKISLITRNVIERMLE